MGIGSGKMMNNECRMLNSEWEKIADLNQEKIEREEMFNKMRRLET